MATWFDGVSTAYLSRTKLVPPMWITIHMGGTSLVRDRYELGTSLVRRGYTIEASRQYGGSVSVRPFARPRVRPASLLEAVEPQGPGAAATLRHGPPVACPRPAVPPSTWFSVSQICKRIPPSLRAQADLLTELPLRFFKSPSKSEVFGDLLATCSK